VVAGPVLDIDAYLAQHERRELLRFVAVGSVDDGKSTLIGRLLHDSHGLYEDQLSAVQRASKTRGSAGGAIDFSLVTDGLKAEREQGITIDVAYRYFSTEKRKFIIADTPGHVQYTRNMATGASTADVALILIDAENGVLQQSRRHAFIASLLGIPHLLVCVNKMDLLGYRQDVYEAIKREFSAFAEALRFKDLRFVPVSAIHGDNVVNPSESMPWYGHDTVLGYLERVPIAGDRNLGDFRFPVQLVIRPDMSYRGYAGAIASGVVRSGDDVTLLPSGKRTRVVGIDRYEGPVDEAFAPMSIALRLADELDVSRGDMIVHTGNLPTSARRFEAQVVWLSETPLDRDKAYLLKHTTRMVRANVEAVRGRVDLDTLEELPASELELNDIGRLVLSTNQELYVDPYTKNRQLGAFVIIDPLGNNTVAAGMIVGALDGVADMDRSRGQSSIASEERSVRHGHRAAVVCFAGDPSPRQEEIAWRLERELFDRGWHVTVIDVATLADGTRSPALLADLAAQCVAAGLVTIFSTALPRPADRRQLAARIVPDDLVEVTVETQGAAVEAEGALEAVTRILALLEGRDIRVTRDVGPR
jgi:sulfate adenylyltransferase large subunit